MQATTLALSTAGNVLRPAASQASGRRAWARFRLPRLRHDEPVLTVAELPSQRLERVETAFIAGLRGF